MSVAGKHPTLTRRAAVVLTALAASAAALTGCSNDGAAQPEGNHLTVWMPGNNAAEIDLVTKTLVPAFEQQRGVTVDVTFVDWTNISTKLNAAFAAGSAPDVFGHGPAAAADFVRNDRILDLSGDVAKLSADDRKDLANVLPGGQVNGKQYLVPLSMQGSLIMFDAAAFKEAGLDPDKPPTTWEELRTAAEKLTKRNGSGQITRAGLLLPSQTTAREQTFLTLLAGKGGSLLNSEGTKATWNSAPGVEVLDYFTGLYAGANAVSTNLGADYLNAPAAQQPLVQQLAAMTMLGSTQMEAVKKAAPGRDLRVMPPLAFGANDAKAIGGAGSGLMVNSDSKVQRLAWDFISYMISAPVNAQYTEGIGAVPMRTSAASSDYVKNDPIMSAFVGASPKWVANPNVPGWVQVRDTLDKQLEAALNGKRPAKDALDAAATDADKLLKANG